jgi:hypothetical protein
MADDPVERVVPADILGDPDRLPLFVEEPDKVDAAGDPVQIRVERLLRRRPDYPGRVG